MGRVDLRELLDLARREFAEIVDTAEIVGETRIRVAFKDGSSMIVLYPRRDKYSFHWMRKNGLVRINTAPHHAGPTYPRHMHLDSEENIVPDNITSLEAEPTENFRRVLAWVNRQLEKTGKR